MEPAAQQLVEHDARRGGDVERPLRAEHRNPDVRLDAAGQIGRHAVGLVAEDEAHRPRRRPLVEVDGLRRVLDRGHVIAGRGGRRHRRRGVRHVLPRHRRLGAERRLLDAAPLARSLIGPRRDAAEHQLLHRAAVGGAEERAGVVEAADVVEHDDDGQPSRIGAMDPQLRTDVDVEHAHAELARVLAAKARPWRRARTSAARAGRAPPSGPLPGAPPAAGRGECGARRDRRRAWPAARSRRGVRRSGVPPAPPADRSRATARRPAADAGTTAARHPSTSAIRSPAAAPRARRRASRRRRRRTDRSTAGHDVEDARVRRVAAAAVGTRDAVGAREQRRPRRGRGRRGVARGTNIVRR